MTFSVFQSYSKKELGIKETIQVLEVSNRTVGFAIVFFALILSGCAVPYVKPTGSVSIQATNSSANTTSKERIVHETHEHGTHILLKITHGREYRSSGVYHRYFLEKDSKRESLGFLNADSAADQWDNFLLFDERWIALNVAGHANQIRLVQFRSSGFLGPSKDFAQTINVPQKQILRKLYLSKDGRSLVWTQFNARIYQQILGKSSPPTQLLRSDFDTLLPKLELVPGYEEPLPISREVLLLQIEKAKVGSKTGFVHWQLGPDSANAISTKSPDELEKLSRSTFDLVRWAVAENPATPREILERLSVDAHADVAISACRRLYPEVFVQ